METLYEKYKNIKDEQIKQRFEKYYELLIQWNEKFNLTAITEKTAVEIKHFADSLAASEIIKGKVIDIGAGAGFPSIPLKIVNPSLYITMIDSSNKRVTFLKEVIEQLGLEKAEAIHSRAEDLKERECFDFAVARAVAPLSTLAEYLIPFVKKGGKMIAYKSDNIEEEMKEAKTAIKILGGTKTEVIKISLDSETVRSLVIVTKGRPTPKKYPRGANKPRLNPLK
ncbi:MAG: 16S rRNA (guanine(527)-N(7))-methyltransferase RsmG [Clostridia bacterium]|jgi:16S rRNA (guanine527-N7)-methyltransferase|nr:16S rRNA (guanine(527)-N(7))-methyltransferase RsmG [Clostridia bacterium]